MVNFQHNLPTYSIARCKILYMRVSKPKFYWNFTPKVGQDFQVPAVDPDNKDMSSSPGRLAYFEPFYHDALRPELSFLVMYKDKNNTLAFSAYKEPSYQGGR